MITDLNQHPVLNLKLIRESFLKAAPRADQVVDKFYEILQNKFPTINMGREKVASLVSSMAYIVDNLEDLVKLDTYLKSALKRNKLGSVSNEALLGAHYALIRSLAFNLEDDWTDELEVQWSIACSIVLSSLTDTQPLLANKKTA